MWLARKTCLPKKMKGFLRIPGADEIMRDSSSCVHKGSSGRPIEAVEMPEEEFEPHTAAANEVSPSTARCAACGLPRVLSKWQGLVPGI